MHPKSQNWYDTIGGPGAPQTPLRIARTAMEHAALMARNMMSNHTDKQSPQYLSCMSV